MADTFTPLAISFSTYNSYSRMQLTLCTIRVGRPGRTKMIFGYMKRRIIYVIFTFQIFCVRKQVHNMTSSAVQEASSSRLVQKVIFACHGQ
ncbi:hypothetical protein GHT06_016174 [Daphnia sinensis]|uniref:Uncharacterized protein n=1 Tax=Daphnia sinensis TaxID=1820382 RepID=A0AAD5LCH3_9CRUS|nr:hypothetical protein GHT06_016174 [Daphnia sinensis]